MKDRSDQEAGSPARKIKMKEFQPHACITQREQLTLECRDPFSVFACLRACDLTNFSVNNTPINHINVYI